MHCRRRQHSGQDRIEAVLLSAALLLTPIHSLERLLPVLRLVARYGSRVLVRMLLWLLLGFFLLPILWTITSSLKDRIELDQMVPHLLVWRPTLENFSFALRKLPTFPILYRNSLIVTLGSVALQTSLATLAGYGFARIQFRGRDLILYSMILLIFVPRAGGLIAQYELMSFLGLRNNLAGLILPSRPASRCPSSSCARHS